MNKSYQYLNLHLFSSIRVFVFSLFCINIILIVFGIWHILALVIPCLIFIAYLCLHVGTIRVNVFNQKKTIKIHDANHSISLECPITFNAWWQYSFNEGINVYGSMTSGRVRATANDLYVILHLTDNLGKHLCFKEKIELDSRFPNEVEYATTSIPENSRVIKVQRTDKVFSMLQSNLTDTELLSSNSITKEEPE